MASSLFRIKTGAGSTRRGTNLLNLMEQLRQVWGSLEAEREAMVQEQDGPTDFTTPANIYAFVNPADVITESVAEAAFAELDALIGNHAAAVKQACARFLQ
jgi:hypothetical protein